MIKFRIYGTSANGTDIDETVLTDKDGKFLIENLLIGTYTVEELEIAAGISKLLLRLLLYLRMKLQALPSRTF